MNKRVALIGPVIVYLILALLGCESDYTFDRYHHAGDVYQVVGNIYVLGEMLKDDWDAKVMERSGLGKDTGFENVEKIPLGTRMRIVSIEKVTGGSVFGEGRYSFFIVKAEILAPGYEGRRYDARALVGGEHNERFGDHGSNIVSLKPVSQAKQK